MLAWLFVFDRQIDQISSFVLVGGEIMHISNRWWCRVPSPTARSQAEPLHAGPASPASPCMSAYEKARLLNIADNKEKLERLGLRAD